MRTWLAALPLIVALLAGCSRSDLEPMASPDGTMTVQARVEQSRREPRDYLCVVVEVRDRSGRLLFSENSRASDVMRWDLSWDGNDRIRLASSDIGPLAWKRQADGSWRRDPPRPAQ